MDESLKKLESLKIDYELVEHRAVYTIEEAEKELPGRTEIKNLFIQDDKGTRQYLVCMPGHKRLDLKVLAQELGEKKLRFCSAEKVENMLGVKPGSVSLFCCLNPNSNHVKIIFDEDLFKEKELGFHPIINTATVFIDPKDAYKLLDSLPQEKKIIRI
jgi:Ala-tRNA(Pro) deacylase